LFIINGINGYPKDNFMDIKIKVGVKGLKEQEVTLNDTADKYGSGMVAVFATPAMIALMEQTALESVASFLPDGYGTVGNVVNIHHVKPTPIGMTVRCVSELVKVDGRRLHFKVKAYDEDDEIGYGEHQRYIVNLDGFMKKVKAEN
jgi:predicted thioesterase